MASDPSTSVESDVDVQVNRKESPASKSMQDIEPIIARFRAAFSHLEKEGDSICGWLTEEQKAVMKELYEVLGYELMPHEGIEALLDVTPQEVNLIKQFRSRLESEGVLKTEHDKQYCSDLTLLRYTRARDHHLNASYNMLVHALKWRSEHKPWQMENTSSRTNKMSSDARIVGLDPLGRIVVYSSFSHTKERTPDLVTLNTVCMVEKANQCIPARTPGQILWVNNFCGRHKRGFGFSDMNPRFAMAGASVFMDNFPECLKSMVIVDPPSIFFTLWKLLKPILPTKTAQKGEFIDSRSAGARARFEELFGPELAAYLLELIKKDELVA